MTTHVRLHELSLHTREGNTLHYPFAVGINTVVGEIGSGKSSLLELIKFALGGDGTITPAVQRGVRNVTLVATIGEDRVVLARGIGGETVDAREPDGSLIERLATREGHGMRTSSAFLLGLLNLPATPITNPRVRRNYVPLSFFDLYPYMYLSQAEIDRSVVHHLDRTRVSRRVTAFEALMGLTDAHAADLRVRLALLREELPHAQSRLEVADRLLGPSGVVDERELAARRAHLDRERELADAALNRLRSEVEVVTAELSAHEGRLAELKARAVAVARRAAEVEVEVARRKLQRDEAVRELDRLSRVGTAADILGPIKFVQCPRCLQPLSPERVAPDHCIVCAQPEPTGPTTDGSREGIEAEFKRLRAMIGELEELAAQSDAELDALLAERRVLDAALHEQSIDLDRRTREFISPRFEQIADASAASARAEAALRFLETTAATSRERQGLAADVERITREVRAAAAELKHAEEDMAVARRRRLHDLSAIFDEIIQKLDMPWYQPGARIDVKTYLPVVNGVGLERLGSGGMKMITNVAYHLALLTYGLSETTTPLPDLLIIDSPRKNLGVTPEDQAHATEFYRWVSALVRGYEGRFQLIVADNDPPLGEVPVANRIELSHESPLVKDLPHPGEGVSTIGS